MSEIEQYTGGPSLPDKMEFAKALAHAGMIPKVYQAAPANVLVAIELGEALGIKPIVAINEINVINGTPSPSASLMISLARAAGHKVRVYNDDTGAGVCEIIRADDPDFTHRSVWDEAKARKGGLWGKGHWGKDPATMLRWRAASECVRLACSEVLGGLKYTPEEVAEFTGDRDRGAAVQVQRGDEGSTLTVPGPEPEIDHDYDGYAERVDQIDDLEELRSLWQLMRDANTARGSEVCEQITARVRYLREQVKEPSPDEAVETVQETLDAEIINGAA